MFERLTPAARRSVVVAQEEARGLRSATIGPEHVLLGVLADGAGTARDLLTRAGLTANRARDDLRRLAGEPSLLSDADAAALRTIGIDVDEVLRRVEETFGPDALATAAPSRGRPAGHIPFTPPAKKV